MTLWVFVGSHVSVEVSTWEERQHHDQFFLSGDQLFERHYVLTVAELYHELDLLLDIDA